MHPVVLGNEFNDREASGLHSYQHGVGEVGARFALRARVASLGKARERTGGCNGEEGGRRGEVK